LNSEALKIERSSEKTFLLGKMFAHGIKEDSSAFLRVPDWHYLGSQWNDNPSIATS